MARPVATSQGQRVVPGDGGQAAAVGAESHAANRALVPGEDPEAWSSWLWKWCHSHWRNGTGAVSRIRRAAELLCNCRAAAAATRFARYHSRRAVSRWARASRHCQTIPASPSTVTPRTAAVRHASIGRRAGPLRTRPETPAGRARSAGPPGTGPGHRPALGGRVAAGPAASPGTSGRSSPGRGGCGAGIGCGGTGSWDTTCSSVSRAWPP